MMEYRSGIGYDIHPLVSGRSLVLGGIRIPFEKGLAGHSDGDVLCHAIMDALLGAASLPDIGHWFPDTDARYQGIRSTLLLSQVAKLLREKGWEVVNVDATIIAEFPRIAPFRDSIRIALAEALALEPERIGVKATTHEGIGSLGGGVGIACLAVCLVQKGL
ncbi:MAG TPA: 2-C-methyl-D-erythritol 2,4-cyclodiphosphate synthase [Atribacteraceae bacterium]|nr:2-C-methyl-D-erythritol 2,4-cyclodiphosphate synthase [Atribacteraceae bacterium]